MRKEKYLTREMVKNFDRKTNDMEFIILYLVHEHNITNFDTDLINWLVSEHNEIIMYLITSLPKRMLSVRQNLYHRGRSYCFRPDPKTIKSFFLKLKDDEKFCQFIIKTENYHKNAAEHGILA